MQMSTTDEILREAVMRAIAADPGLAAGELRVGVLNAVAHLAGRVADKGLWDRAAAVAASVAGVRGVVNRIDAPGAPSPARTVRLKSPDEWSHHRDDQVPQ